MDRLLHGGLYDKYIHITTEQRMALESGDTLLVGVRGVSQLHLYSGGGFTRMYLMGWNTKRCLCLKA